jgi:hypothetical protein
VTPRVLGSATIQQFKERAGMDRKRVMRAALAVGSAALLVGSLDSCDKTPVGPSLGAATLSGIALRSTIGDPTVCCCHVVGTAKNNNSVAVDLTITFAAFDGKNPAPLATIEYFIKNLQPGASQAIDASGFLLPCSVINNVKSEVTASGIAFPSTSGAVTR